MDARDFKAALKMATMLMIAEEIGLFEATDAMFQEQVSNAIYVEAIDIYARAKASCK